MLIVSKFHDYYDSVVRSTGVDKEIVYKRAYKEMGLKDVPESFRSFYDRLKESDRYYASHLLSRTFIWGQEYELRPILIGFCGEIYTLFYWSKPKKKSPGTIHGYSSDPSLYRKIREEMYSNSKYFITSKRNRFDQLNEFVKSQPDLTNLFVDIDKPVWMMVENKVIVDPTLKDINFQKIVDPFTAYQEIYQYLGGVLGRPEKDTVDISDEDLAASKGYDKWSFRKMPEKK